MTISNRCRQTVCNRSYWWFLVSRCFKLTSLMSTRVLRPHPQQSVLNGSIEGICLSWNTWFKHLSLARHTSGWHSYIIDRLMQSDSGPQGASSSAWQLHCGISSSWARRISTFPTGTFTYKKQLNLVFRTWIKSFWLVSYAILKCTIIYVQHSILNIMSYTALTVTNWQQQGHPAHAEIPEHSPLGTQPYLRLGVMPERRLAKETNDTGSSSSGGGGGKTVWNIIHTLTCLYGGGFLSPNNSSLEIVCDSIQCRQETVASLTAATIQSSRTDCSNYYISK